MSTNRSDEPGLTRGSMGARLAWTVACLATVAAAISWVDLAPRVESDFFFSPDDPQLQTTREISGEFPGGQQILVRAESPDIATPEYGERIESLTSALGAIEGVSRVNSIATDRAAGSPLWSRVLLNPDSTSTNLALVVGGTDPEELVTDLEAALDAAEAPDFTLHMSGVPVIVELIRRALFRDLVLFSSAALVVFGLLIGLVYRRARIVIGTMVACVLACTITLTANQLVGLAIGLLTANIVTIVFVLTLSHIVFLTANARRVGAGGAVRETLPASFWAMVTTLLGFLSLTLASARPLRELGFAGAMGTVVAIVVAYLVYPAFLDDADRRPTGETQVAGPPPGKGRWWLVVAGVVALAGLGVPRVDTDPGLLSYFAEGSALREGLELIDRDGGSSTLDIVVLDPSGGRLDNTSANDRMWAFQDSLEAIDEVGVVLSPPVLFGHARTQPMARLVPLNLLADILESPALDRVGLAFLTSDRRQGRFYARMHEVDRSTPRADVIAEVEAAARANNLEPAQIGGVYDLQRELGELIASSLRVGLGGLLILFVGIGLTVSRSLPTTAVMFLCLLAIPLMVLGLFGHLGVPIDMITSPAANVALAMGVDAMIHLTLRARGIGAWAPAAQQMRQPILAGATIICLGFGIFVFSSFPPTARFGGAVIVGTITAVVMALGVLPWVADRLYRQGGAGQDVQPA